MLEQATTITTALRGAIEAAAGHLAEASVRDGRIQVDLMDTQQTVLYDLAATASAVAAAEALVRFGEHGDHEAQLALAFAADTMGLMLARFAGREAEFGLASGFLDEATDAFRAGRDPGFLAGLGDRAIATGEASDRHLSEEFAMVRDAFRRFAQEQVMPAAEHIHRDDADIPEAIITGLAEMGCFALSIPTEFGGMQEGGEDELLNMVVVTEELSRGSLGAAGSLITRPEIIGTAILKGGTDEQKANWLPQIAAGEKMCGVAVTEPDHGSDVAGVNLAATRDGDDWVLNGVKTWCTFGGRADYLLVMARTDPDRSKGHKGLSLFVVEKPVFAGHQWRAEQDGGGSMDARAIPTIGYRGMHSFEIAIENWRVPHTSLIGMDDGMGKGFYLQMQAFANARLQTAARALGVMQSALEASVSYAKQRSLFGDLLGDYELTRTKLGRMSAHIAANRAFAHEVARELARGEGALDASMVKQLSCLTAEWVTRDAQQLHGGYGYAEEYTVSRLFVDARVLSIFEGADEVLALRVIAKQLLADAIS